MRQAEAGGLPILLEEDKPCAYVLVCEHVLVCVRM